MSSDAPLADEPQPGAIPNDQPSGLPSEDSPEPPPMGGDDEGPKEPSPDKGADAMPGIPTEGEPPASG